MARVLKGAQTIDIVTFESVILTNVTIKQLMANFIK